MTTQITPRIQPTNQLAWNHFCELIARGGGVSDHPNRVGAPTKRASTAFFNLEINRVAHHQHNLIPFLIDHCKLSGLKVLEFGAGTGGLTVAMAQAGVKSIEAIEPIELNCEAGRWRTRAFDLEDTIHFHHVPDTRNLPFGNHTFDAVVCSSVLQYVPKSKDRQILLNEMARVIREHGLLIFCGSGNGIYPAGPHSTRWWSNLLPAQASHLGHNRGITFWELNKTLSPIGFRILPQGNSALQRWQKRTAARDQSLTNKMAFFVVLNLFRTAGAILAPITRAPLEAFLPYPDLAFRLENISDPAGMLTVSRQRHHTKKDSTQNAARIHHAEQI